MRGMELIINGEMDETNKEILKIHNIETEQAFEEIKDQICIETCVKAQCASRENPHINDVVCNLSGHLKEKLGEYFKK